MTTASEFLSAHPRENRTSFGIGMYELTISMGRGDWLLIDYVLANHRNISRVVEIGTYHGMTSLYLGVCMALRGGDVYTIDVNDMREAMIIRAWPPNVHDLHMDAWINVPQISRHISDNCLLVVDGGDKYKEALLYAQFIKGESVMMVHDMDVDDEIRSLPGKLREVGLAQIYGDLGETLRSSFAVFKRI